MESVIWAFKQLWDKGLIYEAYRVMPYSWGAETPLSNFEIRLDDATRPRQDPALTVAFTFEDRPGPAGDAIAVGPGRDLGLDDHAVDAPVQPGARGRSRPSTTSSSRSPPAPAPGVGVIVLVRGALAKYEHELGDGARGRGHADRDRPRGPHATARCSPTSPITPTRFRVLVDDFVTDDDGTGDRAHGARLRRGRPAGRARPTASCWCAPSTTRDASPPRSPTTSGINVFDANPQIIADLKDRGAVVRHDTYRPQLPALLAHRHADHLQGRVVVVRRGHRVPRPPGRAQPGDQLDPRRTCATASSASGSRAPATGRSPATGSGARPSRCGAATTPRTRAPTSTDRSTRSRPTSACVPTTCTAPTSTTSSGPTPTTRRAGRRCAVCPRCSTAGSSRGRCRSPRCTTRSRTSRLVRRARPGRLHRRVHRPDPRLVLHAARAVGRAVRPARVLQRDLPRRGARPRGPQALEEAAQLPRPGPGVRVPRLRRAALVPDVLADPAGRRPADRDRRRRTSPTSSAWWSTRSGTRTPSSRCYANADGSPGAGSGPMRPGCWTATCSPRRRRSSTAVTERMDGYDIAGRLRGDPGVPRRAEQLVHPPVPRALLGAGRRHATRWPQQDKARRLRHALHRADDAGAASSAPLLPLVAEEIHLGLTGDADGDRLGSPRGLARSASTCPPTTSWSRTWTRCGRSVRSRSACARTIASGPASRWRASPSPAATSTNSRPLGAPRSATR